MNNKFKIGALVIVAILLASCGDSITNHVHHDKHVIKVDTLFKCDPICRADSLICDHRGHGYGVCEH